MIIRPLASRDADQADHEAADQVAGALAALDEAVDGPPVEALAAEDVLGVDRGQADQHADRELRDDAPGACSRAGPARCAGSASRRRARRGSRRRHRRAVAPLGASRLDRARDQRAQQQGRGEVGRPVEPERDRDRVGDERDEQAGQREADDVGDGLADPQRRVGRQQLVLADDPRQDRDARRPEEDRDRGERGTRAGRRARCSRSPRSA